MSELSVGKEILSHCNKCTLSLAHIILVMKEDGIVGKCQCKTCGAKHMYKDPKGTIKKAPRKKRRKSVELPIGELWQEALTNCTSEPKTYSTKTQFYTGETINHPTFGQGVIEKEMDGNKIHVIFETDYKTLVHNR